MTEVPASAPSHLPRAAEATRWRGWEEGVAEARERDRPILCLAEPDWTNGAQRLALVLGRDRAAQEALEQRFVPVRIDPFRRPDLAARFRAAAVAATGSAGPPLLVLASPQGDPFLAYCTIRPEGGDGYPSLGALLASVAELHDERPGQLTDEAGSWPRRSGAAPAARSPRSWEAITEVVDDEFGGLRERPKHPRPWLLWGLLDRAEDPRVQGHLERTLTAMRRGGILDQLGGSFHRCSRDDRWVVPHFEKLVPQNAALAAVYARAGRRFGRPDDLEVARAAARFALSGLEEEVVAVASDPHYYTWTPDRFQEALDPALVQALGLHVNMTRDESPHVLFRAMEPDAAAEQAGIAPEILARRVEQAKVRLRVARGQRAEPATVRVDAPAWHAETLRWLLRCARFDVGLERARLMAHVDALLDRPADARFGYARGADDGTGDVWLEDQVMVAAACLEASAAGHARASEVAGVLVDRVLTEWLDGDGRPLDRPRSDGNGAPSRDTVDGAIPAAIPTLVQVLRALARSGDGRAAERARAARRIAAGSRPGAKRPG